MKKLIYSILIVSSAFSLASCSADEPGVAKGDGNVTLTVRIPSEAATRFGDAKSINKLYYSVCTTGKDAKVLDFADKVWPAGQISTTVDLQLVPGQTYQVVFFACNTAATGYVYTPSTASLEVTYGNDMINNDAYDAFFAVEGNISNATAAEEGKTIQLTRPFAQLNIGTNDLSKGVVTEYLNNGSYTSSLTLPGLATAVNFLNNTYTTPENTSVTFALDPVATDVAGYPIPDYNYLEMNYLLVDPAAAGASGATLVNATYTINAGDAEVNNFNLSNLPLRANFQTNVYGSLLTQKALFNVEIAPAFATTPYNNPIWDGKTVKVPEIVDGTATVNTPAEFVGLANAIADAKTANNNLGLKEIVLNSDIDLGSNEFLGFGRQNYPDESVWDNYVNPSKYALAINFDGQGHTVKNYTMPSRRYGRGLFNWLLKGSSIKNLTVENVTIGDVDKGNITGVVAGYCDGATFENITVRNCTINGNGKTGGLVGHCQGTNSESTFINCIVEDVTINGFMETGGMIGYVSKGHNVSFTNCPTPDVTFKHSATPDDLTTVFADFNGPVHNYFDKDDQVNTTEIAPTTLKSFSNYVFLSMLTDYEGLCFKGFAYSTFGKWYIFYTGTGNNTYLITVDDSNYVLASMPVDEPVNWDELIIPNPDYKEPESSN